MRCDRAQALMDRYVHEELPPDEREPFESHVRDCSACQQQWAKFQGLLAALQSVPAPPVPERFVDRVIARAQEIRERQSSVETQPVLPRWWRRLSIARLANAVAAVAAGLVLGLGLGQQTWRFATSFQEAERLAPSVDAEAVYSLDYLSGYPRGSFTETYLSLTRVANDQEFSSCGAAASGS
jgi:anti-sigma factor RsiW